MPKMNFLQKVEDFWKDHHGSMLSLATHQTSNPTKNQQQQPPQSRHGGSRRNLSSGYNHNLEKENGQVNANNTFLRTRRYHSSLSLHKLQTIAVNHASQQQQVANSKRPPPTSTSNSIIPQNAPLNKNRNTSSLSKSSVNLYKKHPQQQSGILASSNKCFIVLTPSSIVGPPPQKSVVQPSGLRYRSKSGIINGGSNFSEYKTTTNRNRISEEGEEGDEEEGELKGLRNREERDWNNSRHYRSSCRRSEFFSDLWIHDEPSFERLSEEKISPQSSPLSEDSDITDSKMRWQKTTASSNSSSSSTMSGEGQQRRPKSFDYSQRKAWMKYYRDMEISSVNTTSNNNPGVAPSSSSSSSSHSTKPHSKITKGSISHLHLLPPTSSIDQLGPEDGSNSSSSSCKIHGHPNPSEMGVARRTPDTLGLTPSLFQRFSKTFSLRFGSNSNMNKVGGGGGSGQPGGVKVKASKSSLAVGSSPDLHNRFDNGDMQSGKMRKEKSKSIRGEKCQSGDSGIGIDDSHHPTSRLRRIRSEFIETSCHLHPDAGLAFGSGAPSRNSSAAVLYAGECASAIGKMSLVEIPYWEEEKERQQQQRKNVGRGGALAASYEDVLETKLDGDEDDGFSSGEDSGSRTGKLSDNGPDHINNDRHDNPAAYHHYHSLPHKSSRKGKKENSHHPINLTPSGRSKSLEDEQDQQDDKVIIEDNSIRGKVIREIVLTEQNYVKTLNDIVQGFLNPCRARTDLFSGESVRNIFSNVEDILRLHARFLEAMKERIHPTAISSSHIGQIFTEWADHFNLYSEYCCNNPISMATVRSLMQNQEYAEFFEACRRLQLMDKLPLHGFLLRPIQRICQYHLQLAELLKQTEPTHEDYPSVVGAVETMKSVAMRINDTQRQFDSLQEIIRLQNSIEGWEGSDLLNRNSTILTKGELGKSTPGKRNNKDVYCFLLNKDLLFCKKDYIKKGGYVFDGRIDLEVGVWLNIDSNEEDEYFGMVHNSWRIYSHDQKTWVLFTAPTPTDKRKWITSLESAVQVKPADPRMCTMAKLTTMLSEDRPHHHQSQNYSSNCNTLPKSSKKSKGKLSNGTNGKIDADAMLIEVSKLKRSTYTNGVQQQHPQLQPVLQKDNSRASKFYV